MPQPALRTAVAAASCTFVVVLAALLLVRDEHTYRLGAASAERAALRSDVVRDHLRKQSHTRVEVNPLDAELQRVSFFRGHRLVLDAAVDDRGRTRSVAPRFPGKPPTGSPLAHNALVWALLVGLLIGALAGRPRRALRTLDALALALFVAAAWAYNEAFVAATLWIGAVLLAYLAVRCGQVALGRGSDSISSAVDARLARAMALAGGALVAIVSLTSPGESDVAFASMAGATLLTDGVSPYGHMPPEVLHGDTYPILNYVIHVPAALWLPVRDSFSDMTGALFVATAAALVAAWGVHRAARPWGASGAWRHVLAWFAFPPTLMAASSGTNDIAAAAAVAVGLGLLVHAGRAAAVLAAGAWIKVAPAAVLPLWLARRGLSLSAAAIAAVSAGCIGILLALDGPGAVRAMLEAIGFQAERGSLYSIWAQLDADWLQPAAQAALAGLVAGATALVARSSDVRRDPVRLAALAGAILAALQLSAGYWTFAYLPWLLPPLLLALFPFRAAPQPAASPGAPGG